MRKVCVVGCSGGGKTTFARLLADALQIPHLELDSIYHQPNWTSLSRDEFRSKVEAFTAQSAWVVDGNYYSDIGDITWERADTIVWMDTPRLVATGRVMKRTVRPNRAQERTLEREPRASTRSPFSRPGALNHRVGVGAPQQIPGPVRSSDA